MVNRKINIGDLVRFRKTVRGYELLIGTVIGTNGGAFDVLWNKEIRAGFESGCSDGCIQTELPEFIEVINE